MLNKSCASINELAGLKPWLISVGLARSPPVPGEADKETGVATEGRMGGLGEDMWVAGREGVYGERGRRGSLSAGGPDSAEQTGSSLQDGKYRYMLMSTPIRDRARALRAATLRESVIGAATPLLVEALATKGAARRGRTVVLRGRSGPDGAKGGSEDEWAVQGVDENPSASGA